MRFPSLKLPDSSTLDSLSEKKLNADEFCISLPDRYRFILRSLKEIKFCENTLLKSSINILVLILNPSCRYLISERS